MLFIDDKHEKFYNEKFKKIKELGKTEELYKSIIYTLGLAEETREYFEEIYNIDNGKMNLDSLNYDWQTGKSKRITALAFDLWNDVSQSYDTDRKVREILKNFTISEIFDCEYAKYFNEAIKIKHPQYFESYKSSKIIANVDKNYTNFEKKGYGGYIKIGYCSREYDAKIELEVKKKQLLKFAEKNGYNITRIYCDIGYSGEKDVRLALLKLLEDVKSGNIKGMVTEDITSIIRDGYINTQKMLENINTEIVTIKNGVFFKNDIDEITEQNKFFSKEFKNTIQKMIKEKYKEELSNKRKNTSRKQRDR